MTKACRGTREEDFVQAFLWLDANAEEIGRRVQEGDRLCKTVADNFALLSIDPSNDLAVSWFVCTWRILVRTETWDKHEDSAQEAVIRDAIKSLHQESAFSRIEKETTPGWEADV